METPFSLFLNLIFANFEIDMILAFASFPADRSVHIMRLLTFSTECLVLDRWAEPVGMERSIGMLIFQAICYSEDAAQDPPPPFVSHSLCTYYERKLEALAHPHQALI